MKRDYTGVKFGRTLEDFHPDLGEFSRGPKKYQPLGSAALRSQGVDATD